MSTGRYIVERFSHGWTVTDLADPEQSLASTRRRIPARALTRTEAERLADRLSDRGPAQAALFDAALTPTNHPHEEEA